MILPAAGPTAVACLVLGSMPISATPPTPLAAGGNHVAASPQVGLHCFGEGVGHREAAQAGTVLTEGADEMRGGEARRLKRLLGTHAELHVVEDDLDGCLILLVAARYRDRHHGMVRHGKAAWGSA